MAQAATETVLRVADEVWIALALLHRERPEMPDFAVQEIVDRVQAEGLHKPVRPGIYVHVVQHCVANRPPNPGRYRMLFETAPGRRRLFRRGDSYHAEREGAKVAPRAEDLPHGYDKLLTWYRDWSMAATKEASAGDPLLALQGSGKRLWADEHADDYVRRLREGWE